jgi:hypothetical protein
MKIKLIVMCAALVSLLCWSRAFAEDEPVLVKAELSTHTFNDKDNDTGIYVDVKTADGTTLIARCANADNSKDKSTEYKKNSDHTVNLEIIGTGVRKSSCKGFKVHMWQRTSGWETWRFKPSLTLTFSDVTTLLADGGNVELKNDKAAIDFNAADK